MLIANDLVPAALTGRLTPESMSANQQSLLLRQARSAGLLGRLPDHSVWADPMRAHLRAARRVTHAQHEEIRREARHIAQALRGLGIPVILLKGAAYVVANLPPAVGRVFSDVDVLVPREALPRVESALMQAGWLQTPTSAYDERYYREWMHELPPFEHVHRRTTLDVHHSIVPMTSRIRLDANRLIEDSVPVVGLDGIRVLSPVDMVLHSLIHLLTNDDLSHALRDLSDIDLLLRQFGLDPSFWPRLVTRAQELGATSLLTQAMDSCAAILGTPLPAAMLASLRPTSLSITRAALRWCWRRALRSPHATARLSGHSLAMLVLYARGHWLRMPVPLLTIHLSRKALVRLSKPRPPETG